MVANCFWPMLCFFFSEKSTDLFQSEDIKSVSILNESLFFHFKGHVLPIQRKEPTSTTNKLPIDQNDYSFSFFLLNRPSDQEKNVA